MPRVKRGTTHVKKRKRLLAQTKGFKWQRNNTIRAAKTAVLKAGTHAFRDRKVKKRVNRALWLIKINAACRNNGITYSGFIKMLKDAKVEVDRKVLATIAQKHPEAFASIVEQVKK